MNPLPRLTGESTTWPAKYQAKQSKKWRAEWLEVMGEFPDRIDDPFTACIAGVLIGDLTPPKVLEFTRELWLLIIERLETSISVDEFRRLKDKPSHIMALFMTRPEAALDWLYSWTQRFTDEQNAELLRVFGSTKWLVGDWNEIKRPGHIFQGVGERLMIFRPDVACHIASHFCSLGVSRAAAEKAVKITAGHYFNSPRQRFFE